MKTNHKGRLFTVSVIFVMGLSFFANAAPPAGNWTLVWSDEFDSGSTPEYPNSNNWGYEIGYVRNQEWQYYNDALQNAYCLDGFLHIEAHQHPAGTYPTGGSTGQDGSISSASLVSSNKVEYQYGWLEMRARIDTQWGSWPAFWTLGANGEWPDNGECDIMEYYRDMLKFNVAWWLTGDARWTARWDGATVYVSSLYPNWVNEFHVWSMEWNADQVKLYMDGVLYNTWDSSQDSGDSSIEGFQQPHYIILNQAIGGSAGGDASGIVYPTNYEIDWVRWYQLDVSGAPAAPANLAAFPGSGEIILNWDASPEPDVTHYNVYSSTTSGGPYSLIATSVTENSYTDTGLTDCTTYYYVVTAVDGDSNESVYSTEASGTAMTFYPVTVENDSFEQPGTGKLGNWENVPGWSSDTLASNSGVESGGTLGSWQGYLMGSDPAVWQITSETITAGSTYILEADLWDTAGGSTMTISMFYVNDLDEKVELALAGYDISGLGTATAANATVSYTVDGGPAEALGRNLGIMIDNNAGGWTGVDNVRLSYGNCSTGPDITPPAAPTGLVATAGDATVSLDWADNGEPDLASYTVYRSTTSGSGYASIAAGVAISDYVDNSVTNGTTYYYVVTAVDTSTNESGNSNEDSATPQASPDTDPPTPNPATWATVPTAVSETAISMTATTGSDTSGPVEYYFDETSGNSGGTDSGWQTSSSYTDTGLNPGIQYTYRVQMRDAIGNVGNYSTSESATTQSDTTPPAAPASLSAAAGDATVSLDWADNGEPDLMHYNVYRSTTSGSGYTDIALGVSASDYVDNSVSNGTTYYYVVTAVDTNSNESGDSNEASATPGTHSQITIVGSAAGSEQSGNPAVNSYDGNETTRWANDGTLNNAWIEYDLGSVSNIEQVQLLLYNGTSRTYPIRIEIDGVQVFDGSTSTTSGYWQTTFAATSGRYVTITMTDYNSDGNGWFSIYETQIWGSAGVPDTTPPAAPTGLVTAAGDATVSLDWADNGESDLASYTVYRSTTSGSGYASIAAGVATSDYVDNSVTNGTTYYYVVTALDTSSNESASSNEVSATPQASGGPVVVFSDSFEVAEWNGLWTEDSQNDWFRSTQRSVDGSYSAEVDGRATDAALTSILIDLQGKSNATVTFSWLIESGLDSGEYLAFDVSTNGGSSWTQTATLQGNADQENTWHNESFDITGIGSGNLRIRFRGRMSGSSEDADVDMVEVSAW